MSDHLLEESSNLKHRRPEWRQRLVDAEGGLREGLRADSTLFAFAFYAGVVLLTSLVFGLTRIEWILLVLSLGFALSAELTYQMVKELIRQFGDTTKVFIRLSTTAVVVAHLTTLIVSGVLLWPHFESIWKR